jgi:hypothetical protein
MDEIGLLRLVSCYPHPAALGRRLRRAEYVPQLRRLEQAGLIVRRHGLYRLTLRGRNELKAARFLLASLLKARGQ